MDGKSLNITEEKLNKLKGIIPEAFTENKIDWEKLRATLGEDIEFKNERYVLNWAGKSDAFRVLQSPTTATLVPERDESVNFDTTENIFIEGENLEVLKVLQKSYFGKIKMIYIDPPYNTGNDNFIYPDKFSETKEEYLNRIGVKDESGYLTREGLFRKNSKDNGHYHSNWLSMIYPRLFLARNLLRDDGVIFVSIDDNEVHNLRLLMNEVFGEENFLAEIVRHALKGGTGPTNNMRRTHDYVLVYARDKIEATLGGIESEAIPLDKEDEKGKFRKGRELNKWGAGSRREDSPTMWFSIKGPNGEDVYPIRNDGSEGRWRWGKKKLLKAVEDNDVIFEKRSNGTYIAYEKVRNIDPRKKSYATLLNGDFTNAKGTEDLKKLFNGKCLVDYPKPLPLIRHLVEISNLDEGDIILDYFTGSGSTAQAILEMNQELEENYRFICVQLSEPTKEKSEAFKAGYKTIAEIGKERIRRVIKKIKEEQESKLDLYGNVEKQDLGFKVFKLQDSNFKIWRIKIENEEQLVNQLQQHLEPLDENAKTEDVLYELLLKSGVSLIAKIEEKGGVYFVNNNEIILILEEINEEIVKNIINTNPQKVITLDRLFNNNNQLKTNTALQMKDAGIEFKVV
jgi:adenine-specific DNA-methyltransferase